MAGSESLSERDKSSFNKYVESELAKDRLNLPKIQMSDVEVRDDGNRSYFDSISAIETLRIKSEDVNMFNTPVPMTVKAAPRNLSSQKTKTIQSKGSESSYTMKRSFTSMNHSRRQINVIQKKDMTKSTLATTTINIQPQQKPKKKEKLRL